jgi:hypothetical protein
VVTGVFYFQPGAIKMSTQSQINANRMNAQQSTGPRTDAGKVISSHNAAKNQSSSNVANLSTMMCWRG